MLPSPPSPLSTSSVHYRTVPQYVSPAHPEHGEQTVEEYSTHDRGGLSTEATQKQPNVNTSLQDNRPRFIKQGLDFMTILTDFATVAAPLALLGFGIAVLLLDEDDADATIFSRWRNATTVLATIFPILFASMVGRLVYELARWRLERGSTMGTLEQLMGSRTVGATIITQFSLRIFNPLGICLLLIWSFSPLGAQSLLRMLGSRLDPKMEPSTIVYFDTNGQTRAARNLGFQASGVDTMSPFESSLLASWYNALILAPEDSKTDPMDLWRNVKIPFLSHDSDDKADSEGWIEVDSTSDIASFSSLAGIALTDVPTGNTTLTIESNYLDLNCSIIQKDNYFEEELGLTNHSWTIKSAVAPQRTTGKNGTWHGYPMNRGEDDLRSITWSMAIDRFVDVYWLNNITDRKELWDQGFTPAIFEQLQGIEVKPTQILFQAKFALNAYARRLGVHALCQAHQEYVESRVECSRRSSTARYECAVVAQRPSKRTHAPSDILHFSFPDVFGWTSRDMPLVSNILQGGGSFPDLSLRYLLNPKLNDILGTNHAETFKGMKGEVFSRRFSQIINTYFLLSQQFLKKSTSSTTDDGYYEHNISTPVEVSSALVMKYDIYMGWMTLFFVSCIVLLLSGVSGVVFTHMADGPEILGYASTVVRDSKFIDISNGVDSGAVGAAEISLAMKNERVRYGFMDSTPEGKPLLGVGREGETRPIKDYLA
ncbi:hypothetical protein BHE90_006510 [Fusarium euwallaceae]|uniref:Uncharacterized protein n=1 Tax=Fusarium euwallaceae TaxID=1147111 RepID=A0A430LTE7_9HYPO|nr:hypothetical protein BHE90_006510 [Fusarium euwallaceae]